MFLFSGETHTARQLSTVAMHLITSLWISTLAMQELIRAPASCTHT